MLPASCVEAALPPRSISATSELTDGGDGEEQQSAVVAVPPAPEVGKQCKTFPMNVCMRVILAVIGVQFMLFTVSTAALAGGKAWFYLIVWNSCTAGYATVDLTIQLVNGGSSSSIRERAMCWFASGLLSGALLALRYINLDETRVGTTWQLLSLLCSVVFAPASLLVPALMMGTHRDERRTVWTAFVLPLTYFYVLRLVGDCTPFEWIASVGSLGTVICSTVLVGYVVLVKDHEADPNDVRGGYRFLAGFLTWFSIYMTLLIASGGLRIQGPIAQSLVLMAWSMVQTKIMVPTCKFAFGGCGAGQHPEQHKLWTCYMPGFMLALELGPCLLLVGTTIRSFEFWALVVLQEANSVLKNAGLYLQFFVRMSALAGRPCSTSILKRMEERREVLSPCDNFGEIVSPVVILLALAAESLFFACGFDAAPYLEDTGILAAWKSRSGSRDDFRGETPLMLVVVLIIRVGFCLLELHLRPWVAKRFPVVVGHDTVPDRKSGGNEEPPSPSPVKKRRSSAVVLYDRITRLGDDGMGGELQKTFRLMAAVLVLIQPLMLVIFAATFGRLHL